MLRYKYITITNALVGYIIIFSKLIITIRIARGVWIGYIGFGYFIALLLLKSNILINNIG